ncbi:MAG: MFS transporter [Ktedonobacteraceae bacterium]
MPESTPSSLNRSGTNTRLLLVCAILAFVNLGIPDGLLGTAWPSIKDSFHLSPDSIGFILVSITVGYLIGTAQSGRMVTRLGLNRFLVVATLIRGIGLVGYVIAPSWLVFVVAGGVSGLGGGGMDAGFNTYLSLRYKAGILNWLHATFGLGATAGPLIMARILETQQSWRWGYALLLLSQLLLISLVFWLKVPDNSENARASGSDQAESLPASSHLRTLLCLPRFWIGVLLFLVYSGFEVSIGQWSFTFFTESRGIAGPLASLWISVYWGSLTAGRIIWGSFIDRLNIAWVLSACVLASIIGTFVIAFSRVDALYFISLALVGFVLAPIFPSLIVMAPAKFSRLYVADALGLQITSANLGVAVLPALVGVVSSAAGLESIGICFIVFSIVLLVLISRYLALSTINNPDTDASKSASP